MDKWYKKGLPFRCQGCGKCCYGFPGYVWLSTKDIHDISKYLNIKKELFVKKYTRKIHRFLSLKELPPPSYACIFLHNKKCQIYPVRPLQCKTYPFWPEHLKSKKNWEKLVLQHCIGAHQKNMNSLESIEKILDLHKKNGNYSPT